MRFTLNDSKVAYLSRSRILLSTPPSPSRSHLLYFSRSRLLPVDHPSYICQSRRPRASLLGFFCSGFLYLLSQSRRREAHHPEKQCSTIIFPLFFQYWSQTWDKYHIDLNHCFHWIHWFHWFQPPQPSITTTTLELFLNYFWTLQKTPASAFLKIQIRIFFELLSPSHKPSSLLSYIYFQNTYFKEADTPTFVIQPQEPKNHTEEGSLSESRVVAPIASLILS